MAVVGLVIAAAYLARVRARLGRGPAVLVVTACYGGLAALALLWLGRTWQGGAGIAGMSLPYAVATALVLLARRGS